MNVHTLHYNVLHEKNNSSKGKLSVSCKNDKLGIRNVTKRAISSQNSNGLWTFSKFHNIRNLFPPQFQNKKIDSNIYSKKVRRNRNNAYGISKRLINVITFQKYKTSTSQHWKRNTYCDFLVLENIMWNKKSNILRKMGYWIGNFRTSTGLRSYISILYRIEI